MRSYFVPAIVAAMIVPGILSARSDDVPTLDVRQVCSGIASQSELEAGLQRTNFEQCMQSEQAVREQLKQGWSTFSAADKQHCVALAKTGGESSYTELITCMEMSRDVRALRSTKTASTATTSQIRSSPSMAVQPAPATRPVQPALADSVPQSSSTNKPPKMGADSALKELERVKADAQNARASEATVRGKLASAEADLQRVKEELQRTKEEAGRASKQAEQAKVDAKDARDAKAVAERKLADAEAARSAAEERQRASESESEPAGSTWLPSWLKSLPSWLGSWFGWFKHKPPNP